jgi:hypothetical protein
MAHGTIQYVKVKSYGFGKNLRLHIFFRQNSLFISTDNSDNKTPVNLNIQRKKNIVVAYYIYSVGVLRDHVHLVELKQAPKITSRLLNIPF